MSMIVDAFAGKITERLATLVEERVASILGAKDDLGRLRRRLERIQPKLEAAERRRIGDAAIDAWVRELKDVMYDADDIIDLCRVQGARVLDDHPPSSVRCHFSFFSCFTDVKLRNEIGIRIKSINARLDEISKDSSEFNDLSLDNSAKLGAQFSWVNSGQTSAGVESDIVGKEIEDASNKLVESIVLEDEETCRVFAVTGMGGIGKTTLARKIFNHHKIQSKFPVKAWLCISQDFQRIDKLKELVRKVGGRPAGDESESELLDLLRSAVSGKRLFVVLDDVWQANVWLDLFRSPLHGGASGSRVLVTTRAENVAKRMGAVIHRVELLSVYSGWQLLQKSAYLNEEETQSLWKIGIRIVEKCRGLPLAIKIIAGDLTTKDRSRMEWEKILTSHAWSVSELPEELSGALYLSYYNLPSHLKQCFLYFSLYPEDYTFHRTDLIRHWVAEGFVKTRGDSFMEDLAEEYYQELIQRNLLQPNPRYIMNKEKCTMHDLLRSLAIFLSQDESFYGDVTKSKFTTTKTKLRRLSIPETGEVAVIPESVKEQKCLRTLLLLKSPPRLENRMLMQLPFLRVLVLKGSGIQSIPDSLSNLIHLRLLDLEDTSISSLPESLGDLSNLQILNLSRCHSLYALPKGVTRLHNLIHLDLRDTPLSFVPKGIGSLHQLNLLRGFVVGNDDAMEEGQQEEGCSLEELKPLSQLRRLSIENLERAQRGILTVSDKVHLKELWLCWTIDYERAADAYTEEEMDRSEKLYEELLPPPCLETLLFLGFVGRVHPSWMRSSSLATSLPCLTCVSLMNCILCLQLPPLGQLPNLRILVINKASAIITIGPEFLGGSSAEPLAFPKLEMLKFIEMPSWEEWSFGGEFDEEHHVEKEKKPPEQLLLPRLKVLHIEDCPKLRALPRGLRYCAMEKLYIYTAHSLRDVSNLPFVTEFVQLKCNHSLEAVSHLPALKQLIALDCPALQCVENLDALECLYLIDGSMECLPKWLLTLLQLQQQHNRIDNLRFYLHCNRRVLERCLKGCPDWSIVELIPHVNIYEIKGNGNMMYRKMPFVYRTSI